MRQLHKNLRVRLLLLGIALVTVFAGTASAYQRISRVEAFDTDVWTLWTPSGTSRVVVAGDGDTDLDCYVYDTAGRLLGKDDDATDYCIVDFWRPTSGTVQLQIVNLGDVYNRYQLRVE